MLYSTNSIKRLCAVGVGIALVSTAAWGDKAPTKPSKMYPGAKKQKKQKQSIEQPKTVKSSDLAGTRALIAHYLWQQTVKPQQSLNLGGLTVSGMANLQASYWTRGHFGQRDDKAFVDLDSLYVNVGSQLNDWTHLAVSGLYKNAGSSPVKYWPTQGTHSANRHPRLQEAKVTFANLSQSPFFVRAGQMYLPFGRYKRYPLVPSITQQLTQIHRPGLQVGGIYDSGIYWTAYGVVGPKSDSHDKNLNNYGATMGYRSDNHPINYDLGVSYLHNLSDIDSMHQIVDDNGGYEQQIPAISAYGDIQMGPFSYGIRYVTALKSFSTNIFAYQDNGNIEGARPSAFDIWAGFQFKTLQHHSSFKLAYGVSDEAYNTASIVKQDAFFQTPKNRISINYNVNLINNVILMTNIRRDRDYDKEHGGTNEHEYVGTLRLSYLF